MRSTSAPAFLARCVADDHDMPVYEGSVIWMKLRFAKIGESVEHAGFDWVRTT